MTGAWTVTRSSWPEVLPAPVAPGAPPYWLKYGRSLIALPVFVNSVHTTPKNYFPIGKARMVRYRKNLWVLFGPLVRAR